MEKNETERVKNMCVKVVWNFISFFCLVVPHGCQIYRTIEFENIPEYGDKFVSAGILWNKQVESIFSCAIECNDDNLCMSFFFEKYSCHGYDKNIPNVGDVISSIGKKFYLQTGLSTEPWCSGDHFVYDEIKGKCYKAWTTELSWSDAQTVCQHEGGTLAILDTDTKIDLMASIPDYLCYPGKLTPSINKCYWTTTTVKTWEDSATVCNAAGGMLASFPDNQTYYIVINETGILGSSADWWLGLNDKLFEATMKTYDDKVIPWDNIVSPYGWFAKDCIIISSTDNYMWIEDSCTKLHKAVCEIQLVTDFWIGGFLETVGNVWKWTDDGLMDMSKLQRNPLGVPTCAALKFDSNGTMFVEKDCTQTRKFICEKIIM